MAQPAPQMVPMIGPDGSSGLIPADHVDAAVAAGFKSPADVAPLKEQAAAPGTALPQEEPTVPMVGPDGSHGVIPESKVPDAIAAGFKRGGLAAPAEELGIREKLYEATIGKLPATEAPPSTTDLGAGTAFLSRATGIDPSRLAPAMGGEVSPATIASQHPTASLLGGIAHAGLEAAPLGRAAEAVSGAAKLTGLAKTAVEGAVWGTPDAAEALVNGDPAGAAEALALGVAGNVGLHAVFSAGSRVLNPVAHTIEDAAKYLGEHLGLPKEAMVKLSDTFAPLSKEAGFAEKDFASKEAFLKKAHAVVDSNEAAAHALNKAPQSIEELQGALRKSVEDVRGLPEEAGVKKIAARLEELHAKKDLSWSDARDLKKWMRELPEEAEAVAKKVPRTGPEIVEHLKAHPDIAPEAYANPAKHPDVFFKAGEVAKGAQTAVADAKDIIHTNLMTAQDALVGKLGPKAGAQVVEGLKQENAVYAVEKIFGKLEKIPAVEKKSIFKDVGLLSYRYNPLLMAMHFLGGHAGLTVPFHAGILAFKVGKEAVKQGLEMRAFGQAARVLRGASAPNTSMALDAIRSLDARVSTEAKSLLSSLAARETFKHSEAVDKSIGHFLPNGGVGLSRESQVESLRRAVNLHEDNPGAVADHLGSLTAPLHQEGLSPVATAYTQHQLRLMKVIQTALPADPKMAMPHPFAADVKAEDISPATRARYERTLTIAADPVKLVGFVKANTITPTDVAIATATNPATLQKLRVALVEEAVKTKPDLSYQQRLSMSILMGENLDASTAPQSMIQSGFSSAAANPAIGQRSGVENSGMNAKGQDRFLESSLTTSQRSIVGH